MKNCTPASLALCILSFVTHLSTTFAHFLMACYSLPYSLFSNVLLGNNYKTYKLTKSCKHDDSTKSTPIGFTQIHLLLMCFFVVFYLFIYLFIYGCVGSSFLCEGFL